MAGNYAQLLDIINNPTQHGLPAWDNNAKQIEGETVQQYLLTIINSLTVGYQFMGVATPSTTPGTPDQNVFYIGGAGTYANFGTSITVKQGQICIFKWNGSWTNTPIEIANSGFVNVNDVNGRASAYESASAGRSAVPTAYRKSGLNITYLLSTGWVIEQFIGDDVTDWGVADNWKTIGPVSVTQNTINLPIWQSNTTYKVGNQIRYNGVNWRCSIAHTSGSSFDTTEQNNWSEIEFANDGESLQTLSIGDNENPLFSNCIKLDFFGSGTDALSTMQIGDIGYITSSHLLRRRLGEGNNFNVIPFYDGAIYTYNNKLYIWDGADLIELNKNIGDIIFMNVNSTPVTYPNFKSTDMTFNWPSSGGGIFIGNKGYSAPPLESRTISLLGINSTAILLTFNLSTRLVGAKAHNDILTNDEVLIAVIRTDAANTPTEIRNVSCGFDYTIDGKTPAEIQTKYQDNIIYVQDNQEPTLLVNIDTSNWKLQFSPKGGQIWIGKDRYQLPTGDARDVTLSGINSTLIKVLYDTQTSAITAHAYNEVINSTKILLCVIRTDAANTPTKLLRCDAVFDYTIDGKNKDKDIRKLQDDINKLNSLYPYMDVFKSIPATEINTEFQSMCKVGDEFWIATGGSGQGGSAELAGYIHRYNSNWEYIGKMEQQGFHFNSMDYDADTDRLISGEAGEGSNEVYIFGNVSQWPTTHASTPITSADIERIIVLSQVDNRPNPVWAERNALGHREMIISANLNTRFIKIKLGYGTNQLQYGAYTASSANVPNGTYAIDWNYKLTIPELINQIGQLLPYSATVCQDIAYYKGKIYTMTGAVPTTLMELTITDNGIIPRVIHQLWGDDTGNVISNCANEGIICEDGKIYCGIAAIGMDTSITEYNNKIVVFDM